MCLSFDTPPIFLYIIYGIFIANSVVFHKMGGQFLFLPIVN